MNIKFELRFLNLSKVLLILLPFSLITGPLFSEISILFISITLLYYSIKKKLLYFQIIFQNFLIFYAYLIFNSIVNFYNYEIVLKSFSTFVLNFLCAFFFV